MTVQFGVVTKPMLAGSCKETSKLNYPVAATPKIDGIRCLKKDGKVVSRTFKPIKNDYIRETLEAILPEGADGEIIVGTTFQECSSGVMTKAGKPDFTYYMFDYVKEDVQVPYVTRMEDMLIWYKKQDMLIENKVVLVLPYIIEKEEDLLAYEEACIAQGYEGVMVRKPEGPYKNGRSSVNEGYLLKIKRFLDSEAEIVGFEELMHNDNEATKDAFGRTERSSHKENKRAANTLGNLIVKDVKTNVEFAVGTGFDAATRKQLWEDKDTLVGMTIKYSYFPVGVKDKPRHPVFLGFRDHDDM